VPEPQEVWRDVLLAKLDAQRPHVLTRMSYYAGEHRLPVAPRGAREAYTRLLASCRTNWCRLVVDAVAERLRVVGFRFGGTEQGDSDAWLLWQANRLDADHERAQNDALVCGSTFVLVWPDEASPVGVTISVEHPLECALAYEPGARRTRIAGVKSWVDVLGQRRHAWVVTPEGVWRWERALAYPNADVEAAVATNTQSWELVDEAPNPLGVVPLVEITPWPRTLGHAWSEIDGGVIDIQDRINTTILNRMMATEYAAFRQKWATGLVLPNAVDPVTGEPLVDPAGRPVPTQPFDVAVDRLWVAEDPGVKFGEFSESDLSGYIKSVEADVQHLAAITHTPPHYLLGSIVNASGDALKASEAGLVSKVRHRAAHIGEGWEEVLRLAFAAVGNAKAIDVQAETIWHDFETRSEAEHVDALVKLSTIGVPREVLWQKAGASPQEVERWRGMNAAEALTLSLVAPAQPTGAVAG
jgi:hypothetical protein